jgi:SOS-response transcriptional repressor LexA
VENRFEIGRRLAHARAMAKQTLREVATRSGVTSSTVLRYENGEIEKIKLPVIEALANTLGVNAAWVLGKSKNMFPSQSASFMERHSWAVPLVDAYERSSTDTQQAACAVLRIPHVIPDAPFAPSMCEMIVFDYPAAAGLPLYAESDFERVEFPEDEVPSGADFGIRVSGDSMEPTIADGSTVWVHKQSDIRDGEIGIFTLADSAVCKRARLNGRGRVRQLESDNPAYESITGSDLEDLRIVGKVLL